MFPQLHERALQAAQKIRTAEAEMLCVLQEIDACKGHRDLGYPSLFSYAHRGLGLPEALSYHLITVGRKAKQLPALQAAILNTELTVAKAKVISAVITEESASEWLTLAKTLSTRALEKRVAETKPDCARVQKVKYPGKGLAELTLTLEQKTLNLLERAQTVLAQKKQAPVGLAEVIHAMADDFLDQEDPLRQAARAQRAKSVGGKTHERHRARLRDQGECQFKMPDGQICGGTSWVDLHHIQPRSEGGSDLAENLVTLCSAHHQIVHAPP